MENKDEKKWLENKGKNVRLVDQFAEHEHVA